MKMIMIRHFGQEFTVMEDWTEEESTRHFNTAIFNLNSKNNRNKDNLIKGMIMGHSPQFMFS